MAMVVGSSLSAILQLEKATYREAVVGSSLAVILRLDRMLSGDGRLYSRFAKRNISHTKYISHRQIYRTKYIASAGHKWVVLLLLFFGDVVRYTLVRDGSIRPASKVSYIP